MLYRIMAMLVLILFYATYFLKALIQKRQGIQTRQIGKHKEKDIHTVEILMSIATLCAPIVQLRGKTLLFQRLIAVLSLNSRKSCLYAFDFLYKNQFVRTGQ